MSFHTVNYIHATYYVCHISTCFLQSQNVYSLSTKLLATYIKGTFWYSGKIFQTGLQNQACNWFDTDHISVLRCFNNVEPISNHGDVKPKGHKQPNIGIQTNGSEHKWMRVLSRAKFPKKKWENPGISTRSWDPIPNSW